MPETYTQTPNSFFEMLPTLSYAELKVLLVVIRLTYGFHKKRVWISNKRFVELSGLSRKAVSTAVDRLVVKSFISVTDLHNKAIDRPEQRKSCPQIYYSFTPNHEYLLPICGKLLLKGAYLLRSIKEKKKEKELKKEEHLRESGDNSLVHVGEIMKRMFQKIVKKR